MHAWIILIQVGGPHLVEVRCREPPGDDADLCGIAKLGQELLARLSRRHALARCRRKATQGHGCLPCSTVVPGEVECAYVGDADPGYGVANSQKK